MWRLFTISNSHNSLTLQISSFFPQFFLSFMNHDTVCPSNGAVHLVSHFDAVRPPSLAAINAIGGSECERKFNLRTVRAPSATINNNLKWVSLFNKRQIRLGIHRSEWMKYIRILRNACAAQRQNRKEILHTIAAVVAFKRVPLPTGRSTAASACARETGAANEISHSHFDSPA